MTVALVEIAFLAVTAAAFEPGLVADQVDAQPHRPALSSMSRVGMKSMTGSW